MQYWARVWLLLVSCVIAGQGHAAVLSQQASIADQATFDRLQRTYIINKQKRPHVLFMWDRKAKRMYYANSKLFDFHYSFAKSLKLSGDNARQFFLENYIYADRPLIIGTVGYFPESKQYYWEFSDKNVINDALYKEAHAALTASFFAPLHFKPNSVNHEQVRLRHVSIPTMTLAQFSSDKKQEVYSQQVRTGILRFVDTHDDLGRWQSNDIVVFNEAPNYVTPLQGIITLEPSSPLAHIHMLALNWKVPDVYWSNMPYQRYVGKWVTLDTRNGAAKIRHAHDDEIQQVLQASAKRVALPAVDVTYHRLTPLHEQRAKHSNRFGFKAANLGHVSQLKALAVPKGYSIPFYYYDQFLRLNQLDAKIAKLLAAAKDLSPEALDSALQTLRQQMMAAPLPEDSKQRLLGYHRDFFAEQAVFVRSSTNAEDAPGFSGAGLYTSVPNVRSDDAYVQAVKAVWASIWNLRAFEARAKHGIPHHQVMASVLIQRAMQASSAGVLVTQNPFNQFSRNSMLINAKRGLGIKVVEGQRVPEQILYHRKRKESVLLSTSLETTKLVLDVGEGVKEVLLDEKEVRVLTDDLVHHLAAAAEAIEALFAGKPQDIEWLVVDGKIWIVQARPFIY